MCKFGVPENNILLFSICFYFSILFIFVYNINNNNNLKSYCTRTVFYIISKVLRWILKHVNVQCQKVGILFTSMLCHFCLWKFTSQIQGSVIISVGFIGISSSLNTSSVLLSVVLRISFPYLVKYVDSELALMLTYPIKMFLHQSLHLVLFINTNQQTSVRFDAILNLYEN